ncbi:hypothetical protein Tco_0830532 [Tanacetum coccineum]
MALKKLNLVNRVFDLENTKTAQAQEIDSLKEKGWLSARTGISDEDNETAENPREVYDGRDVCTDVLDDEEVVVVKITSCCKDKGKGIMVEEPLKIKKKDQISFDEHKARRLQAEIDEEERIGS